MHSTQKHFVFIRRMPQTIIWGGLEKLFLDWLERIDYKACRVTLAVTSGGKALFEQKFKEKNLPIHIIEFSVDFKRNSLNQFCEMYWFLRPLKPSTVIFVQGAFTDFYLGVVLAGFLVTRNNVYMHENLGAPSPAEKSSKYHWGVIPGMGLWWHKEKLLNNLRGMFSKRIFVVSHEIQEQLIKRWGYPRHKVVVSYHGIDLEKFTFSSRKRQHIRKLLKIPPSDFVFMISARLAIEKRIDRAIEAFDRITEERDHSWLLILGEGNLKEDLEHFAQQKKCRDKIKFLGYKDNVGEYLNAADCYVSSSDTEGLSIALLEAMAAGITCVATDCTGSTELIQRSQSGFLVAKSTEGVFQGMRKAAFLSPEEKKEINSRGTQFIAKHFEYERQIADILIAMQIPNIAVEDSR